MSDVTLKKITAPSLIQPNYGDNIDEQFNNINENFDFLSNRDFIKGDKGDSVKIKNNPLIADGSLTNLGKAIIIAVLDNFGINHSLKSNNFNNLTDVNYLINKTQDSPAHSITVGDRQYNAFDCINENSYIRSICIHSDETNTDSNEVFIDGIVITDGRFGLKNASNDVYSGKTNITCSVYVNGIDENGYNIEVSQNQNSLYYDSVDKNFYWIINGERTGLLAQGPKGEDGKNAKIPIFMAKSIKDNLATIAKVLDSAGNWKPINVDNYNDNDSCIVFADSGVYFSSISKNDDIIQAVCMKDCELLSKINRYDFMNNLTDIGYHPTESNTSLGNYKHGIYRQNDTTLNISASKRDDLSTTNLDTTLNIDYNKLSIGNTSITTDGCITASNNSYKLVFDDKALSISNNNKKLLLTNDKIKSDTDTLIIDNNLRLSGSAGIGSLLMQSLGSDYPRWTIKNEVCKDYIEIGGNGFAYIPSKQGDTWESDTDHKYTLKNNGFQLSSYMTCTDKELTANIPFNFKKNNSSDGEFTFKNNIIIEKPIIFNGGMLKDDYRIAMGRIYVTGSESSYVARLKDMGKSIQFFKCMIHNNSSKLSELTIDFSGMSTQKGQPFELDITGYDNMSSDPNKCNFTIKLGNNSVLLQPQKRSFYYKLMIYSIIDNEIKYDVILSSGDLNY